MQGDNRFGSIRLSVCLSVFTSAERSSSFWTRGLASLGLAGTRGLASPIEEVPSHFKAGLGLASPAWTSESQIHSSSVHSSGITKTPTHAEHTGCRYVHKVVTGPIASACIVRKSVHGPGLPVMEQFVTANNLIFLSC